MGKASRREFAKLGAIAGIGTALGSAEGLRAVGIAATNTAPASELAKPSSQEESSSRGRLIAPLINHVGYRPGAGKFIVIEDLPGAESFELVRVHKKGMSPVFVGKLASTGKDFGPYLLGDFSSFREPGIYRVNVPVGNPVTGEDRLPAWSYDFGIGERVWDDSLHKLVNYYRLQACGASRHGYNSPCHTGKIERDDHGEAVPITGGWHSAHDHLRDLSEILHGVFGLLAVATARPDLEEELGLFDEIRWGNDYFLSLQSPPGYVCFGVYAKHYYDYERWDWWDSASYILITKPAALIFQHNFIAIQAMIAMLYQQTHPEYAARCREAGRRSFEWVRKQPGGAWGREKLSYELGTGVLAGVEMFRATGEVQYRKFAAALANQLVALQQPAGFFAERQGSDLEIAADLTCRSYVLSTRLWHNSDCARRRDGLPTIRTGPAGRPAWTGMLRSSRAPQRQMPSGLFPIECTAINRLSRPEVCVASTIVISSSRTSKQLYRSGNQITGTPVTTPKPPGMES